MRFHFGVSVRPKNIIKWFLLALFGLLAFLGIGGIKEAKALTTYNGRFNGCFSTSQSTCVISFPSAYHSVSWLQLNGSYPILNMTFTDFGNFTMQAHQPYVFVFSMYQYTSVPVTGEIGDVIQFYIKTTTNSSWYLTNTSCVFDTYNNNTITCTVVPDSTYEYINHVQVSFTHGPGAGWLSNTYRGNSTFTVDTTDTYYNELNEINSSINKQSIAINGVKDAITDGFDDLSGKLVDQSNITNDIYEDLTDDSYPDSDISSLGSVSSLLPAGPVDSLLAIPVTFLNKTITALGGTCSPFTFTFVFDEEMTFPCFEDLYDEFPAALKIFCDTIPAGFLLIAYFKHLYKKVDRATSLNADSNDDWGVI